MTDSTRVNETIAFINNNATYPLVRRTAVAQFCRATYPKLSLLDFGAYNTEFHTMSGEMSVKQNATVPTGDATARKKRRAIFLIWKSIARITHLPAPAAKAQAAMTTATGGLDALLDDAMLKGSVFASAGAGADVFATEVQAHPRQFLAAHKVIVLGVPTGGAKFTVVGGPDYTNVLQFYFQYDPNHDRFVFNGHLNAQIGAAHPFSTVSVPAVNWYDVPGNGGEAAPLVPANFANILGCQLTGATFMVTTQFTGCTFCWTDHGGTIRACHIGPTKAGVTNLAAVTSYPGGGNGVATRVVAQGAAAGMANAPGAALRVFGRGAGNAPAVNGGNAFYPNLTLQYATIIGRNSGGGWKFYLQAIDSATHNIVEARRIM